MTIRAILFDKDGTLFDFNASWGRLTVNFINALSQDQDERMRLAAAMVIDYERAEFFPHSPIIAGTSEDIFRAIDSCALGLSRAEIEQRVQNAVAHAAMVPVCDLVLLFEQLQPLKLGIATNDQERAARQHLEQASITKFFDFIAGADSGYGAKPSPGQCTGFLRAFDLEPHEAVMVGDSNHDIDAGRAAGMLTIGVLTGTASRDDLARADIVLEHIGQIPKWLAAQ